jgi:mono/diheme cytochrome c family protein
MTTSPRIAPAPTVLRRPLLAFAVLGAIITGAVAQGEDPVATLPDGPKTLLGALGSDAAAIGEIVGSARSSEEWVVHLGAMGTAMTEGQVAMLADYLSRNAPVAVSGTDAGAIVAELPADGRELFASTCFSCHGVVSYYLLQDRDEAGWMAIFDAPYHRRLLTGDNERETFANYAAHAMPIPEDTIPEAWKQ